MTDNVWLCADKPTVPTFRSILPQRYFRSVQNESNKTKYVKLITQGKLRKVTFDSATTEVHPQENVKSFLHFKST